MNILLASSALGVVWLLLLFALCFLIVHVIRLAQFGRQYQKEKQTTQQAPSPPPEQKTPSQREGEPVYYIVEKKRRNKTSYGEPKRIQFK